MKKILLVIGVIPILLLSGCIGVIEGRFNDGKCYYPSCSCYYDGSDDIKIWNEETLSYDSIDGYKNCYKLSIIHDYLGNIRHIAPNEIVIDGNLKSVNMCLVEPTVDGHYAVIDKDGRDGEASIYLSQGVYIIEAVFGNKQSELTYKWTPIFINEESYGCTYLDFNTIFDYSNDNDLRSKVGSLRMYRVL